jgi:hypothetical protein
MSGYIYCFEPVSDGALSPSQAAEKVLRSATYFVRGIRFYELTDRKNPKPLFAVSFAHHTAKHYFEEMLECLLERSGLRAEILKAFESPSSEQSLEHLGAANANDFDQRRVAQGGHHAIPPSLKEWVQSR